MPMRRPEDIHSMIDYLTARGNSEADISILKWVLGNDKSEWERKYDQEVAAREALEREYVKEYNALGQKCAMQDAEIRRLKSEPDHK